MKWSFSARGIRRCYAVLALVSAAAYLGCGGSELGATVRGTVMLDGRAIGPGVVIFGPLGGKENPATGTILPDGSYFVKTGGKVGLPPSTYQVCVQVNEIPEGLAPGQRSMAPTKSLVPEKYTQVSTSGLEFEVEPGSNTFDINLTTGEGA